MSLFNEFHTVATCAEFILKYTHLLFPSFKLEVRSRKEKAFPAFIWQPSQFDEAR